MSIIEWVETHAGTIAIAAAGASAVLNMALRFKSAESWVEFAERRPRLAALVRIVRAVGIDPAKVIRAVQVALNARTGKAPPSKPSTDDVSGPARHADGSIDVEIR